MKKLLTQFWSNQSGFIVSSEMLFLYTITVLGIIVGMTNVQRAIITEFTEVANSLLALDQSYNTFNTEDIGATAKTITAGSSYLDVTTFDVATNSVNWTTVATALTTADQGGVTSTVTPSP